MRPNAITASAAAPPGAAVAPENANDPPAPPAPENTRVVSDGATEDAMVDSSGFVLWEELRGSRVEKADGRHLQLMDLLIDDSDWSVAYLEVAFGSDSGQRLAERTRSATRCLVPSRSIDCLNSRAGVLNLAVWADELRRAPLARRRWRAASRRCGRSGLDTPWHGIGKSKAERFREQDARIGLDSVEVGGDASGTAVDHFSVVVKRRELYPRRQVAMAKPEIDAEGG